MSLLLRGSRLAILLSTTLIAACSAEPPTTHEGTRDHDAPTDEDNTSDETTPRDAGSRKTESATPAPGNTVPAPSAICAAQRVDAPASRGSVDVVWLVDTSGSMWDEFAQIQKNLASFTEELSSSSPDMRVVMVTGVDPAAGSMLGADQSRYRFVPSIVDSQMLYTAALAQLPSYRDFLRPNAATHFVMVTDDQDTMTPDEFRARMTEALGHPFTLHAIASEEVLGRPCASAACGGVWIPFACGAMAIGEAYNSLAEETGGGKISICSDDWTSIIARLGKAVIAAVPLPCEYPIERFARQAFNKDLVQVVYTPEGEADEEFPKADDGPACGSARGWYFDDATAPKNVLLCPSSCSAVQQGGSIDIAFGCKPTVVI